MNRFLILICVCVGLTLNVSVADATCKLPLAMPGQDATWSIYRQGVFVEENWLRKLTSSDLERFAAKSTLRHLPKNKFEIQCKIVDENNGLIIAASKNKQFPPFGFVHVFLLPDSNSPDFAVLGYIEYLYSATKEE